MAVFTNFLISLIAHIAASGYEFETSPSHRRHYITYSLTQFLIRINEHDLQIASLDIPMLQILASQLNLLLELDFFNGKSANNFLTLKLKVQIITQIA